jgi:hypothetical protein
MGEHSVKTLRADVRGHMKRLAAAGLGTVSGTRLRDVFVLDPTHPGATRLSPEAGKHENFIRSEDGSLLFRDASAAFAEAVDPALRRRAMTGSETGLEFRWTQIDKPELRSLFAAVLKVAGS